MTVPPDHVPPRQVEPLLEPRDGLPDVVDDQAALLLAVERIRAGSGPVAVDAERASGYRYGNRAYLVQLRRAGSGTVVVDPVGCDDLTPLAEVLDGPEWIVHAASQDLACLAEIALRPRSLFDTELAGRLLGYPRVALGTLVEEILGFRLEKGHAAADWSTRPLPADWVRYAALDVELLLELREALAAQLVDAGKLGWATEEFAAVVAAEPPPPREDPWRRTSGMHRVHKPRQLAVVRELWLTRDHIAERRNLAPGRVLTDAAIIEAALALPTTAEDLGQLKGFGGRATKRHVHTWFKAIETGLLTRRIPPAARPIAGPPPPRTWSARNPRAATRLARCREAVTALAAAHILPVENLVSPDAVRRLAWDPPEPLDLDAVTAALAAAGARRWQVALTAQALTDALRAPAVRARIEGSQPDPDGRRIALVPITTGQAEALRAGEMSDLPAGPGWPHADTLDGIGAALAGGDPEALPWLVVLADEGIVVGDLGWKGAPSPEGEVEIGYGLAAPYRGRGLGALAVRTLLEWLTDQPTVRRVVAQTTVDNEPSRRLLERLGFGLVEERDRDLWYALDLEG